VGIQNSEFKIQNLLMIVCPNCNHQNPDGALQCEACYTPLPTMTTCSSCGASVQADASFCGQCGSSLQENLETAKTEAFVASAGVASANPVVVEPPPFEIPELPDIEPLVSPEPIPGAVSAESQANLPDLAVINPPEPPPISEPPAVVVEPSPVVAEPSAIGVEPPATGVEPIAGEPVVVEPVAPSPISEPISVPAVPNRTQLQTQAARLLHLQTNTTLEIPANLSVVHIGKPNDRVPPDIDVAGFANSEIVSRVHADIRVEGDIYYLEDIGSANGTYVNNTPLSPGNRHRLRAGDRIALGKGDKVTFLFQLS
jgi:ribosomal protein L40E